MSPPAAPSDPPTADQPASCAAQDAHPPARQRRHAHRAWKRGLLDAQAAMQLLGLIPAELDAWTAMQRIPVALHQPGRRGAPGQMLFDPQALQAIPAQRIAEWRAADMQALPPEQRSLRAREIQRGLARMRLRQALAAIEATQACMAREQADGSLVFQRNVLLVVPVAGEDEAWTARVLLHAQLPRCRTTAEVDSLAARVAAVFTPERLQALARSLADAVADLQAEYANALAPVQQRELRAGLRQALSQGLRQQDLAPERLKQTLLVAVAPQLQRIEAQRARELVRLQDYPQAFPLARSLARRIHFRLGPTNSGKTHEALEALTQAQSGVYLAPLRLLAMEIRDRLVAQGIPCNLLTGEEHDRMPGARHTASTVEMMNPQQEVEVAVIDEIQMLQDPARGWAWTSALVGVPARQVYLCGADTAYARCVQVLESMGEAHETRRLSRKTPLVLEEQPLGARRGRRQTEAGLRRGDAVIAFSRKDVLTLSARYRAQGLSVATIYGALAPEVRRTEAERFASGAADIVVATDAIGMGLNLPVRRVVFSTVHKFDGQEVRPLTAAEVQQIAGRAGRYGLHAEGRVGAMDAHDLRHLRRMLEQPQAPMAGALPIAPSPWHVDALAQLLGTQQIAPILSYFATRIAARGSLFETAALEDQIGLARVVDRLAGRLPLADKFTFSCAPVAHDKANEQAFFEACLLAFARGRQQRLPAAPLWLRERLPGFLEEAEFLSKDLSLYAWLSYKFPQVFCDGEAVPALREQLSRYVERELLRQGGFGRTAKEAFQRRRG